MPLARRQLTLRLALIALVIAAALGGPACGSKKVATPGTGTTPFQDGTWIAHATITAVAGDPGCTPFRTSFVDTFTVAGGQVEDLLVPGCDVTFVGTQFREACADTMENSDTCQVVQTLMGSGTVTGNYFSGTWTLTFSRTPGSCRNWNPQLSCSYSVTATGQRLPGLVPARARRVFATLFERMRGAPRAAPP